MRALLISLAFTLLALPASAIECAPIPGSDALWSKPETRFILVGEIHGTAETPAIFADLVCAAGASKRPIVVAIEHAVAEQPALDAFMNSSGDPIAIHQLLANPEWHGVQDGRESGAYLGLIETLRRLKAEGRIVRVVAMQGVDDHDMASRILGAGQGLKDPLTLVYGGNVHMAKTPPQPEFPRGAASYLPGENAISLLVTDKGGAAWNQQQHIGVNPNPASTGRPRGITFGTAWLPGYDGELSTGAPSTASPPAVNQLKR
jgi:hypothetical protein